MFAIGNKELSKKPVVKVGQAINCPNCKRRHKLCAGKSTSLDGREQKTSETLLFYKCKGRIFIGALAGKLIAVETNEKILNNQTGALTKKLSQE